MRRAIAPANHLIFIAALGALSGCAGVSQPPIMLGAAFSPPVSPRSSLKDGQPPAATVIKTRHVEAQPPAQVSKPAHGEAVDCGSDSACLARLKALIEDPNRQWIGKQEPAAEYAQGIRLFAYRALKVQLSCDQLRLALGEIDATAAAYRALVPGLTPEQVRRVRLLAGEVQSELTAERASRCSA